MNIKLLLDTKLWRKRNLGFSLLEAMLSLAILSGALVATLNLYDMYLKNSKNNDLRMVRRQILLNLGDQFSEAALNSSARISKVLGKTGLSNSLPNEHFELLEKCLPDLSDVNGCAQLTANAQPIPVPFYFHNAAIEGTESNSNIQGGDEVFYNKDGMLCQLSQFTNAQLCPFEVETFFIPYCPQQTAECNKAQSIKVTAKVSLRSDYPIKMPFKPLQSSSIISLQKGIQLVQLTDSLGRPVNSTPMGIYETLIYRDDDLIGIPKTELSKGLIINAKVASAAGLIRLELHKRSVHSSGLPSSPNLIVPASIASAPWTLVTELDEITDVHQGLRNQTFSFNRASGAGNAFYSLEGAYGFDGLKLEDPVRDAGFYQFKVVGVFAGGKKEDSTNFASIRVYSTPQIIPEQSTYNFKQVCNGANFEIKFKVFDDEGLSDS